MVIPIVLQRLFLREFAYIRKLGSRLTRQGQCSLRPRPRPDIVVLDVSLRLRTVPGDAISAVLPSVRPYCSVLWKSSIDAVADYAGGASPLMTTNSLVG